jgi:DNA-binding NarL/FixJ family response regulator
MVDSDAAVRLIIADDDYLSAHELQRYLTAVGYDVVDIVKTADEALASTTQHKPDFIIMSVQLGGSRSGVEAAQEIFSKL